MSALETRAWTYANVPSSPAAYPLCVPSQQGPRVPLRCSAVPTVRPARALRLNPLTTTPPVGPGYNNSYFTALESPPLRNTDHNGLDTSVIVR